MEFKTQLLENFANELKANGFKVLLPQSSFEVKRTYFYFSKDDKIGYCQYNLGGGIDFNTVHIPNRLVGSGFRIHDGVIPTVKIAQEVLNMVYPNWASQSEKQSVKKYKSLEEFREKSLYGKTLVEL